MKPFFALLNTLRSQWAGPVSLVLLFAWGVLLGLFLHYLLYRLALPLEPFIYVAF